MKSSQSIDDKIIRSIRASMSASAYTTKDFLKFGQAAAVGQALGRLTRAGRLRRVRQGVYDLPRNHPLIGQTSPNPQGVVATLMKDSGARWQFAGAYAANLLGLSEQVPTRIVVLTDGTSRQFSLGKLTVQLRHAAPRNLLGAGKPAGLVIQALRHLKKTGLSDRAVAHLKNTLDQPTKQHLEKLKPDAPAWMRPIIDLITQSS
jgi:hypothetical protein